MKKIAILTINDNNNYGNRLQNYATQVYLEKYGLNIITILNMGNNFSKQNTLSKKLKNIIKRISFLPKHKRYINFIDFNSNINFYKDYMNNKKSINNLDNEFDYFLTGSDQVWNPEIGRLSDIDLLMFATNEKKIAWSASIALDNLDNNSLDKIKKQLPKFKAISVREENGKKIIQNVIDRKDIEVLIDPTLLLSKKDWEKVCRKPKILKDSKYILNYFLGDLSQTRRKEIERIAKENNCKIINILDKNDPFYVCGPSEFLYLEKNAFLVCTDSFHSSVFAFIFDTPFLVFDRNQKNMKNMNSRIENLISKFELKNRFYEGKISQENINHDYTEAYKILSREKKKTEEFIHRALDI